jgi:hypothetical protein
VVAASQHLHQDIARLRRRARALESALSNLHYQRAGFAHPLLGRDDDFGDEDDVDADVDRVANDVSSLHLSTENGLLQLFGNVDLPQGTTNATVSDLVQLPPVLDRCIRSFPFPTPPDTREQAIAALRRSLPDRVYVEGVLHTLFEDYIFTIPAVDKTLIFVELLPGLYNPRLARPACTLTHEERGDSPRVFALVYALLAHGVLMKPDHPDREMYATTFSRLSLAGLGAESIFDKPSYMSVLVLTLHSVYHVLRQKELGQMASFFGNIAIQGAMQVSCQGLRYPKRLLSR